MIAIHNKLSFSYRKKVRIIEGAVKIIIVPWYSNHFTCAGIVRNSISNIAKGRRIMKKTATSQKGTRSCESSIIPK